LRNQIESLDRDTLHVEHTSEKYASSRIIIQSRFRRCSEIKGDGNWGHEMGWDISRIALRSPSNGSLIDPFVKAHTDATSS